MYPSGSARAVIRHLTHSKSFLTFTSLLSLKHQGDPDESQKKGDNSLRGAGLWEEVTDLFEISPSPPLHYPMVLRAVSDSFPQLQEEINLFPTTHWQPHSCLQRLKEKKIAQTPEPGTNQNNHWLSAALPLLGSHRVASAERSWRHSWTAQEEWMRCKSSRK